MSRLTLGRRRLLKQLGLGAAAAVPVFHAGIRSSSAHGDDIPKRFIGVYHPAGWRVVPRTNWYYKAEQEICDEMFFPGRRRSADYALADVTQPWPEETQPLQRVEEELVFVDGLHNYANRGGNNHMAGTHTFLSGADPLQSFNTTGGVSLDYFLSRNQPTMFAGLNLAVNTASTISSSGPAQKIWSEIDPLRAYQTYFATFVGDEDAQAELARRRLTRRSVLDHLVGEIEATKPWVASHDRPRLEAHADAIRSMELRIDAIPREHESCVLPTLGELDPANNDAVPELVDAMLEILAVGLACDLSRSATFAFGRGTLAFVPTFLGLSEHYHAYSHYSFGDTQKQAEYAQLLAWTADKVAGLIERLRAIPEADGTSLLHHSLLAWNTDNSAGWAHTVDDVPFVLAGQAGGALATGRTVSYEHGTKHNRLLLSIARAFGEDIDAFGPADYNEGGVLPRLFS